MLWTETSDQKTLC